MPADSVIGVQGIGNGGCSGHQADFSDALGAKRPVGIAGLDADHDHFRHLGRANDPAFAQQQRHGPAVFHGKIFRESIAEPHMNRTFNLALEQGWIHDPADVVGGVDPVDLPFFIQGDHLGGVAVGVMGFMADSGFSLPISEVRSYIHVPEYSLPARSPRE